MSANSRYARVIKSSQELVAVRKIIATAPIAEPVPRGIALAKAKAKLQGVHDTLDSVAQECAMAKGMYASNRAVRDAILAAGDAIVGELPFIAKAIEDIDQVAKQSDSESLQTLAAEVQRLALNIGTVSFAPMTKARTPKSDEPLNTE